MDLVTHGLMGTIMAAFGLKKKFGAISMVVLAIGNIAPDLDVVTFLRGPKAFYKYHREVTHSLMGAAILWVLISAGIYFFTPLHDLLAIIGMVGAGIAGHLLLDSLTPWGLPLFYPFKSKKYSFDLIWFFDPFIILTMLIGVNGTFALPEHETIIALLTVALIFLYLMLRVFCKRKALKLALKVVSPKYREAEIHILPSAISPFLWDVIFKARSQYFYTSVDVRRREILASKEVTSATFNRYVKSSCCSEFVKVFLKRSRFPFYQIKKDEGCYKVEWCDVQLMNLGGVHGVTVSMDDQGMIIGEKLQVKKPVRRRKKRAVSLSDESV